MKFVPGLRQSAMVRCLIALLVGAASATVSSLRSEVVPVAKSAQPAIASDAEMAALKKTADAWLASTDDVTLHKESADMYRYIDGLLARHDDANAKRYLERMLRADPWALDYQLTFGELLARQGDHPGLVSRVGRVIRYAEDDATLRRAYRLVNRPLPASPPSLADLPESPKEVVLVQTGTVGDFCLADLRDALAQRLPVPVKIARLPIDYGPPDRSALDQYVEMIRRNLLEIEKKETWFDAYLTEHHTSAARLSTENDEVLRIARLLTSERGGKTEVDQFNARLEELRHREGQWEADKALARTRALLRTYTRPGRRFIAVTGDDLFAKGSNYVFGNAYVGGPVGLISCKRFLAAFDQENPDRRRLQSRLVKQALSSLGNVLGVPRCSNPECARAYPSSVAEQDAKSDQLCSECRAGFEHALGLKLPEPPSEF